MMKLFKLSYVKYISLAILLIIVAVSMLPVQTVVSAGSTYYVATTGNDANVGSLASPWRTINHAAETMTAGDTTYVRAGTYSESVHFDHSGTSSGWITLSAYPGETVIIDGTGESGLGGLVSCYQQTYIVIDGFEIRDSDSAGIYIGTYGAGSTGHYRIYDCTIHDTATSGIHVNSTWDTSSPPTSFISDVIIDGCETYNTNSSGSQEAISFYGVTDFEISNCYVHDTLGKDSGVAEINKEGIDLKGGTHGGSVHHNEVARVAVGIYIDHSIGDIDIYNNYIHHCTTGGVGSWLYGHGLALADEDGTGMTVSDVRYWNNILANNYSDGFTVAAYTFTANFSMINNTFYSNGSSREIYLAVTPGYSNCVFRNNIVFGDDGVSLLAVEAGDASNIVIDHNIWWDSVATAGDTSTVNYDLGTNKVIDNPDFVNAGSNNFSLQSTSPGINAGSSSSAPSNDYAGASRPQALIFDIGAYEYVSLVTTTTTTSTATPTTTTTAATIPPTTAPPTSSTPTPAPAAWRDSYTPRATPTGSTMTSNGGVVLYAILPVAILAFTVARMFKGNINPILILGLIIFMAVVIYATTTFLSSVTF